jgi:Fe-S cluster assembly protein SufD
MNAIETINERYHQLQGCNGSSKLTPLEQSAFEAFAKLGVPTVRHEEWKYTRITPFFNKDYHFTSKEHPGIGSVELNEVRLPGYETANELVFVNGRYSATLSSVMSAGLLVQPLEDAANNEFHDIVAENLGHSSKYIRDGIHAMNTAFIQEGVFIHIKANGVLDHPVYIYHITDARHVNILSQPRSLIHIGENAQVQFAEAYATIGHSESFTNQVVEIVVEQNAVVEYYKIQNDKAGTGLVSTTHFRQRGKSVVHTVTISLGGGLVRNNLNIVMEADHSEALLHGLYLMNGQSHIDNHTVVDNVRPHCLSNELYKGIVDNQATAVFNGKIFVQQAAQKTNAFQSNKNILLSDNATVNTKPQLEIFADDVKCSHGCTIGQLDEEGMFYLQSRGIPEKRAKALLVQAFAVDILEHIKLHDIRNYIDHLISERLESTSA